MVFKRGDFVTFDYIAKIKESDKVFDTTIKEVAEKNKLNMNNKFEPRLLVVGEGWILKPLDSGIADMEIDKPILIEIPPVQAFGERDPHKVKEVPLRVLKESYLRPILGRSWSAL